MPARPTPSAVLVALLLPTAPTRASSGSDCAADDTDDRIVAATELLEHLSAAGLEHVPLRFGRTHYGGLGVFLAEKVGRGTTIFRLPSEFMLHAAAGQASLPLALARERRHASSETMRLFIRTLPKGCPDNLAIRGEDDLALVSQSLHAWKADLLRRERQAMHASGGDWSEEEVRWATCMKLSRAFAGTGSGPVMMPLMDLFNHNHTRGDCRESGRWVDESAGRWTASIVAERDLPEGTELVYPYSESPSKARLLTSFGFTEGAASATLAATQLPERDASFMAAHGCHGKGAPRTDLDLEPGATVIGQANLRDAVRCIRLALYTPEEASWALKSGHLDGPWGGVVTAHNRAIALGSKAEEDILASVLEKDHRVAVNTGRMCEAAHTEEQHEAQARLLPAASPDLQAAISEEASALQSCAAGFRVAQSVIHARGVDLFG